MLPALSHSLVKTCARKWIRNRVAHVVEGQAAREVDAPNQRVGGLPEVADHEKARFLDTRGNACLYCCPRLVRRNALLHLFEDVLVSGLDAEEDPLAARAAHLLEELLVDMRDPAEAFPRQGQVGGSDCLGELERPLVVEREEIV